MAKKSAAASPPVDLTKLRSAHRPTSSSFALVTSAVAVLILAFSLGLVVVNWEPATFASSPQTNGESQSSAVETLPKRKPARRGVLSIVETFPHDTEAFTQGLCFHEGHLYESTGELGKSTVRQVDLATGRVLRQWSFPEDQFGEGMTIIGDRLYALTWQSHVIHVLNLKDFSLVKTLPLLVEGWGLTHGPNSLIMSDGSNRLYFLDPESLEVTRTLEVVGPHPKTGEDVRIDQLNELEFINGTIWANIWLQNLVVVISPKSGRVLRYLHIDPLATLPSAQDSNAVPNGIAYEARSGSLYLTGKRWPALYRVEERGWEEAQALWKGRRYHLQQRQQELQQELQHRLSRHSQQEGQQQRTMDEDSAAAGGSDEREDTTAPNVDRLETAAVAKSAVGAASSSSQSDEIHKSS